MALDVDSANQLFLAISDQSTQGEPRSRSKPTQPAELRLGIVRSATGYHERVDETFKTTIEQLSDHGVTLVDELTLKPSYDGFYDDTYLVLLWEFKEGLNAYLSTLPAPMPVDSLPSLIAFNRQHADEALRYFPQDIFERAASLTPIDAPLPSRKTTRPTRNADGYPLAYSRASSSWAHRAVRRSRMVHRPDYR